MTRAVFTVDLKRCTGCYACQIACKDRAGLPDDLDWLRVEGHEAGAYPHPSMTYRVVHCFHCAAPPCAEACPVGAISADGDGSVRVDAAMCIGCRECVHACPFGAVAMLPTGIATKCDGCLDELAQGFAPTCVRACPMRALAYGAPEGLWAASGRSLDRTFDDHGVGPAVTYLV